jgi:hypothetical protein
MRPPLKSMIVGWAGVFMVAVVLLAVATVVVLWLNGKSETTARDGATRFATALVHNDPGAAPPGAGDYVTGVRAYFGAVRSARVIGAHNRYINGTNRHTRSSFFVSDLLLRTESGPAVIELEFRLTPFSDFVGGVHELRPGEAPGLTAQDRNQLVSAFAARGGKPADQTMLSESGARTQRPTPATGRESPPTAGRIALPRRAEAVLRCVRRAGGDAAKLQLCGRS